jgi:hypothetical protein
LSTAGAAHLNVPALTSPRTDFNAASVTFQLLAEMCSSHSAANIVPPTEKMACPSDERAETSVQVEKMWGDGGGYFWISGRDRYKYSPPSNSTEKEPPLLLEFEKVRYRPRVVGEKEKKYWQLFPEATPPAQFC